MVAESSRRTRRWIWIAAVVAVVLLGLTIAAFYIDEPLRRYAEAQVNGQLKGYTLHIGKLDVHPARLSLDLEDVSLIQKRNPDPPMVLIPKWHANIQWSTLFKGEVVSDHVIERPSVYMTRPQVKTELRDKRRSQWQDAVRALFPLRISALKVEDADVTYFDHPNARPVKLNHVQVRAGEISNRSSGQEYPSTVSVDADLFKTGHVKLDGSANFLAQPFLGLNVDLKLERVPVEELIGVTGRYNLQLSEGVLAAEGRVEYSPWMQAADIRQFVLERAKGDYVYRRHPRDEVGRKELAEAAKQVAPDSQVIVKVGHGKVLHSEFGFVNKSVSPEYRVFVADVNADMDHFTNQLKQLTDGDAVVKVTGRFMGTGQMVTAGTFRPEKPDPDFDLNVSIVKTDLKSFNDVLRAYTGADVSKGAFSLFSELSIKNGEITGYLKPIFGNVEVYDPKQDQDKAVTRKVYEAVIQGVVELLKNPRRREVAAEADVTGPVPNPQADTWQIVASLIRNAFFKAILPELEKGSAKA